MNKSTNVKNLNTGIGLKSILTLTVVVLLSCGSDDKDNTPPPDPQPVKITIDPATTYQEMVGFGGALTWYSERILSSSKQDEITSLIFDDLGTDIVRFKNCYYPDDYPDETGTESMSDDYSKGLWDATNELHAIAKSINPSIKVLFSSWGPPAALKSNGSSREGTLLKSGGEFVYDAYAEYWENLLDHLPFTPDYISIQNEPTYVNSGWTTCAWAATETADLPGYALAVDLVNEKLQEIPNPPIMIGPESQDIPKFGAFADALKNKAHVGMYAYHPYNINSSTSASDIITSLQSIKTYNDKPNIMTEFADNLSWFNTALFINNTLIHANSSGYIYWKMMWETPAVGTTDAALVSVGNGGTYTVTPFYYLMKHFAKDIDAGYKRVAVSSTNINLNISAFVNPAGDKLTLIVINGTAAQVKVVFEATGKTLDDIRADQSKEGSYYQAIENVTTDGPLELPAQTITTVVLDI